MDLDVHAQETTCSPIGGKMETCLSDEATIGGGLSQIKVFSINDQ